MVDIENDIWYWYHNISECYYHIQLTIKYRKSLFNAKTEGVIVESMKGFKERYAIEIQTVGFDRNHVHYLCRFFLNTQEGRKIYRKARKERRCKAASVIRFMITKTNFRRPAPRAQGIHNISFFLVVLKNKSVFLSCFKNISILKK